MTENGIDTGDTGDTGDSSDIGNTSDIGDSSDTSDTRNHSLTSNSKYNDLQAPNVKQIISFAIPAIGIWLCGPLLSLIDTSTVGLLSGTAQQAALNPAITITDDGSLLVVCY